MKQFVMSKFASELDLYKAKAGHYQGEVESMAAMVNTLMADVMPQFGGLVIQDYANLNELLMKCSEYK